MRLPKRRRRYNIAQQPNKNTTVVVASLVLLLAIGVTYAILRSHHHRQGTGKTDKNVVTYSTDSPSEKPVTKSYQVAPNEPKEINIPAIQADGYIQKVGVDQKNQIAAPNNVHAAGWYVNSLKPGEAGLSIIDGHVDGPTQVGIFDALKNVKAGDSIIITFGDGHKKTFQAKSVTSVDEGKAAAVLFGRDNKIKSQLDLITCGGVFNRQLHQYNQRVIVVAGLVN